MSELLAQYHWIVSRIWSELGVAFDWDYATTRGARHIDAWIAYKFPDRSAVLLALRALRPAGRRTR